MTPYTNNPWEYDEEQEDHYSVDNNCYICGDYADEASQGHKVCGNCAADYSCTCAGCDRELWTGLKAREMRKFDARLIAEMHNGMASGEVAVHALTARSRFHTWGFFGMEFCLQCLHEDEDTSTVPHTPRWDAMLQQQLCAMKRGDWGLPPIKTLFVEVDTDLPF